MCEMMTRKNGKWVEAEPIPFSYPRWITMIPIKWLREIIKKWYWEG